MLSGVSAGWRAQTPVPVLPIAPSEMATAALLQSAEGNRSILGTLAATALTQEGERRQQADYLDALAQENQRARDRTSKSQRRANMATALTGIGSRMAGSQLGLNRSDLSIVSPGEVMASLNYTLDQLSALGDIYPDVSRYTERPYALTGSLGSSRGAS